MDIKKPQLVKVEAFAVFLRNSSATPSCRHHREGGGYWSTFTDDVGIG